MACTAIMTASAQDLITKADDTTIQAKVTEITESVIKYHRFDNLNGPIYTLPISSVKSIKFENGSTETFIQQSIKNNTPTPAVSTSPDAMAQQQQLSDNRLLNMYNLKMGEKTALDYVNTAKKYKKIGWIGGASLAGIGLAIQGVYFIINGDLCAFDGIPWVLMGGVVAGGIWYGGWYMAANRQMKLARQVEIYSISMVENEVLTVGDKTLTAGINLMGNNMTNTRGIGISLAYNF